MKVLKAGKYVYDHMGERAYAPHCDPSVLHAPGVCEFCDHYPDWQKLRETWMINFTGEDRDGWAPDPATYRRGLDNVNAWGGNRPGGYE